MRASLMARRWVLPRNASELARNGGISVQRGVSRIAESESPSANRVAMNELFLLGRDEKESDCDLRGLVHRGQPDRSTLLRPGA